MVILKNYIHSIHIYIFFKDTITMFYLSLYFVH